MSMQFMSDNFLIFLIPVVFILITLFCVRDAAKRTFPSLYERILWIQLLILIPIVGWAVYFFVARKRGTK